MSYLTLFSKTVVAVFFSLLLSIGLTGCDTDGPAEEAGEEIDQAVDNAGDALEDAADDVEDEIDENT